MVGKLDLDSVHIQVCGAVNQSVAFESMPALGRSALAQEVDSSAPSMPPAPPEMGVYVTAAGRRAHGPGWSPAPAQGFLRSGLPEEGALICAVLKT